MLGSSLTNRQKWMSYSHQLWPALAYPLPAVTFSEKDYRELLRPAFPSIKHGLSLSSKTNNSLLFFPEQYGGFGVHDMWIQHLAAMSRFVVQHFRNADSCGRRIKSLLAYHQLEAGISASFITLLGTKKESYLSTSPISHLASGLKKWGLSYMFHTGGRHRVKRLWTNSYKIPTINQR